jgi:flagellar basal body-associated protein FliL
MAEKSESEKIVSAGEQKSSEQLTGKGKGNKAIIMMGIVVLISVGCAFIFVSKVYPSLIGRTPDGVGQENNQVEETQVSQTVQAIEADIKPVSKKKGEESSEPVEEVNLIVAIDTIIVNLSASNGRRYLKVKINLEAKDGDVKKKIESKPVQIKDRLISILSSKTLEEIDGLEGQENLRNEIKNALDVILKTEGGVLQVYFTEFVIQ